jgi:hypothetical protein
MLNDPLLPPPPPSARISERTAESAMPTKSTPTRRTTKKPATAAKILVTGLSAVAVIGMASGYTLAGKSKAQQINNPVNNTPQVALQTSQDSSQSALAPVAPIPNIAATPAPVIVVPVPQATAATPGNSTNNWQQQQSSGSR